MGRTGSWGVLSRKAFHGLEGYIVAIQTSVLPHSDPESQGRASYPIP